MTNPSEELKERIAQVLEYDPEKAPDEIRERHAEFERILSQGMKDLCDKDAPLVLVLLEKLERLVRQNIKLKAFNDILFRSLQSKKLISQEDTDLI